MTGSRITCVHPNAELYGADRVFLDSVEYLSELYECTVYVQQQGPLTEMLREVAAEVHVLPTMLVLRKGLIRGLGVFSLLISSISDTIRFYRRLRSARPALVYVSTVTTPTVIVASHLAGIRCVCHVHEAENSSRLVSAALTAPLNLCAEIISISRAAEGFVTSIFSRLGRKSTTIYSSVMFPTSFEVLPRDLPAPLKIGCIGRWSERKGTDVAIEALSILRGRGWDAGLELYGGVFPGYEWFEQKLRSLTSSLELDDFVFFNAFTPDRSATFGNCHLSVVPSRVEPFGLVAVESRAWARITLVSRIPGLMETVEDGAQGWVFESGDPTSLADTIEAVLRKWPDAVDAAEESRVLARASFAPERFRREILQMAARNVREVEEIES